MRYDWSETKHLTNIAKHGVTFEAVFKFDWDTALIGTSFSSNEPRLVAVAPIRNRLHVLVFCLERRTIRVISLCKANCREIKRYEEQV